MCGCFLHLEHSITLCLSQSINLKQRISSFSSYLRFWHIFIWRITGDKCVSDLVGMASDGAHGAASRHVGRGAVHAVAVVLARLLVHHAASRDGGEGGLVVVVAEAGGGVVVIDGREDVHLDAALLGDGRGGGGARLAAQGLLARVARLGPARLAAEVPPPPAGRLGRVVAAGGGALDGDDVAELALGRGAHKGELVQARVAHVLGRAEEHRGRPEEGVPESVGAQHQTGDAVVDDARVASRYGDQPGHSQGTGACDVDEGVDQERGVVAGGEIGLVSEHASAREMARGSLVMPEGPEDESVQHDGGGNRGENPSPLGPQTSRGVVRVDPTLGDNFGQLFAQVILI